MSIRLRPLTAADLPDYTVLYTEAFPPAERKPLSFMTEGPLAARYDVLAIDTDRAPVSGMVILVTHGDLVLLDYFAVSPALRGQGIGHDVLPLIRAYCAAHRPGTHLFLEIEVPCGDCDNPVQRVRRKAFYLSAGLVEAGVQAHIYGSDMELLAFPADAPFITLPGYAALLRETFPPDMVPDELKAE